MPTCTLPAASPKVDHLQSSQTPSGNYLGDLAIEALAQTGISELRRLRVDTADNKLTLTGAVGSYYHKQLAQETVRSAAGGTPVENNVAVCL